MSLRAAGFAISISIFLIHLFGDIASPVLIGELSGPPVPPSPAPPSDNSSPASAFKPVPTPKRPTNLTLDRLTISPVMILGSFFFLLGSRSLPTAQDRAHEAILNAKPSAPRRSL